MGVIAIGSIITGTGSFLPETRLTNQMLEQMVDTSDEWIVQRTGIRERRVAVDMQAIDVALPAAQRALDDAGRKAEDIDLIIACTVTPDSFTPTLSCAIFLPMPGARVRNLVSPVIMDSASWLGGALLRMASAAFGPTPETLSSILKQFSSSISAKPYRSQALSRTLR